MEISEVHAEVFASDGQPVNVGLVAGDALVFKVNVGGGRPGFYLVSVGVGMHAERGHGWLDADVMFGVNQAWTDEGRGEGRRSWYRWESDMLTQVRVAGGYAITPNVSVFAGPTLNYLVSFGPNVMLPGSYRPPDIVFLEGAGEGGGGGHQIWLGAFGGVRL